MTKSSRNLPEIFWSFQDFAKTLDFLFKRTASPFQEFPKVQLGQTCTKHHKTSLKKHIKITPFRLVLPMFRFLTNEHVTCLIMAKKGNHCFVETFWIRHHAWIHQTTSRIYLSYLHMFETFFGNSCRYIIRYLATSFPMSKCIYCKHIITWYCFRTSINGNSPAWYVYMCMYVYIYILSYCMYILWINKSINEYQYVSPCINCKKPCPSAKPRPWLPVETVWEHIWECFSSHHHRSGLPGCGWYWSIVY